MILDTLKNNTIYLNKYATHSETVVISCFFNPQKSEYRNAAFKHFYNSIKHLNHRIIECVIGDSEPQLEENKNITRIHTESLLWHKEAILNKIISDLPKNFKYVFWIDADVIFTNRNWLVDSVKVLQTSVIMQPFEYCVHLDKDQLAPGFSLAKAKSSAYPNSENSKVWRSFCANYVTGDLWRSSIYNNHGHVGFAWGAQRELFDHIKLYDHALIGGADHIIAHAAAGQVPCECITKSFKDNIKAVNDWSREFYSLVGGKIGYVSGDLYHIWHGDINKRQYLKRVQDFTHRSKSITSKDSNGLYVAPKNENTYMENYFRQREVSPVNDGVLTSFAVGYATGSPLLGTAVGGNFVGAELGALLNEEAHSHHSHDTTSDSPSISQPDSSSVLIDPFS